MALIVWSPVNPLRQLEHLEVVQQHQDLGYKDGLSFTCCRNVAVVSRSCPSRHLSTDGRTINPYCLDYELERKSHLAEISGT